MKKYEAIKEFEVTAFKEFEIEISGIFEKWRDYGTMYYRGHAENSSHLTPRLFRDNKINNQNELYKLFQQEFTDIKNFTQKADDLGISLPDDYFYLLNNSIKTVNLLNWINNDKNNLLELLTVGQHYGVKTRFLDFTKDPYIALYFASEGAMEKILLYGYDKTRNDYFCVWMIDAIHIYDNDKINIKIVQSSTTKNKYLNAQKGLFLTLNKLDYKFDESEYYNFNIDEIINHEVNTLCEEYPDYHRNLPIIYKFNFPYCEVGKILWTLRRKNISYCTIRPHLENIQKETDTYNKWFNQVIKKYSLLYF